MFITAPGTQRLMVLSWVTSPFQRVPPAIFKLALSIKGIIYRLTFLSVSQSACWFFRSIVSFSVQCLSFWSVSLSDSYFQIFHIFHFGLSVCQPAISNIQCLSFWSVSLSDSCFQKFHICHFDLSVCQPATFENPVSLILVCQSVRLIFQIFHIFHFGLSVCQPAISKI